jgi:hypothetical protein
MWRNRSLLLYAERVAPGGSARSPLLLVYARELAHPFSLAFVLGLAGILHNCCVHPHPSTPLRYAQDERGKGENVKQFLLMLSVAAVAVKSKHELSRELNAIAEKECDVQECKILPQLLMTYETS